MYFPDHFLNFFFSLLYGKDTVYNTYNIQNMLIKYILSNASNQQWAISS